MPLIQGGLEIPVEVEVQMENKQALSKYKTLTAKNKKENTHMSVSFVSFKIKFQNND